MYVYLFFKENLLLCCAGLFGIVPLLKVSKSQNSKAILLETPLPEKQTKYLTKFCPMKLGQNFVKYFVRFSGNGVSWKMLLRFTDLYILMLIKLPNMKIKRKMETKLRKRRLSKISQPFFSPVRLFMLMKTSALCTYSILCTY